MLYDPDARSTPAAASKADEACLWLAAAGAIGVIVGAVGPWATAWGVARLSGTDMHGLREVAVGALALLLLAAYRWSGRPVALLLVAIDGAIGAAGAAAALAKIEANDTLTFLGFSYTFLRPAWGLYVVLLSAVVVSAGAATLAWRTRRAGVLLQTYAKDCP